MEKLFNDEEGAEYDTYEIEFKILDQNKQPKLVVIELQKIKYKKPYFADMFTKPMVLIIIMHMPKQTNIKILIVKKKKEMLKHMNIELVLQK